MKRLIISMLVVILLTSFCLVPAYAQLPNLSLYQRTAEKTQYRLKLEAGKQYYIQTINELHVSSSPTPAKEGSMEMSIGTGAKLDVSNIDANGNAQLTYTYKWVKYGIKLPGREMAYDSSKKDSTVPEEFQWFAPLLEESFSLTISPEGRISEIKDLDKVRNNVKQKLPQESKENAMSSLDQWLNEQTMRESIENSLAIYPDRPVSVGDSWSRNVTSSGGTAMILENKWTLKERKNGVAVIEVVSTIKPNPQAKPTEMGSPGVTSSSEFNGNQQGLIQIQESTGLVIKSEIIQQMTGKTTIKNSSNPDTPDIVQPMEIKSVLTTETSDWEKARTTIGTSTVAQEQPRREGPMSRQDSLQRRANLSAASQTSPYMIEGEEQNTPARSRRPQRQTSNASIHAAVVSGDIAQVQSLLSSGTNINSPNRSRFTPLHVAVLNRKQEIIELLVSKDADLNAQNNRQQTPLIIAADTGQKEVVELLISKGADVNILAGGDNALTTAQKKSYTEIVDILVKNGATEPSPQDLMGDRYYGEGASPYGAYQEQGNTPSRTSRNYRAAAQQPVEVDLLADPNEIIARVKTFAGLQKALDDVGAKSQNETRQWQQTRYDNRTMLIRNVQKQFEDEINLLRIVSVSEKAQKTTEAINSALSLRQGRFKAISKELIAQRREQRQTQQTTTRGRSRGRTSGRGSTRGMGSQNEQQYESSGGYGRGSSDPYGRGNTSTRSSRYPGTARGPSQQPAQPVDMEAQNESNQWLQASFDNKSDLASAVNDQIQLEVTSIRDIAVEETAKKTTAAIDGLLLARRIRLDAFLLKMQDLQQSTRYQSQDPRMRGANQQDSRYNRGGEGTSGGYQQGNQRTRRRR
ncbi:MAG: ankyrin repeat domain-containing protein [Planctomycetes bacterium]|nr:ankyrin repeat domain-containing protein [Planctomycetota bacterium]